MLSTDSLNRCHYRDSAGRRCRLPRERAHPTFCSRHARPAVPEPVALAPDLSSELLGPLRDFRTVSAINYTLGRLLILKAADVISARDASVIAYICQLLIQTVPGVRAEMACSHGHSHEEENLRGVLQATASVWETEPVPDEPLEKFPAAIFEMGHA